MTEWLSIVGIGEDGAEGLPKASRDALAAAEVVFGGPRHLAMVDHSDKRDWPVPFSIARRCWGSGDGGWRCWPRRSVLARGGRQSGGGVGAGGMAGVSCALGLFAGRRPDGLADRGGALPRPARRAADPAARASGAGGAADRDAARWGGGGGTGWMVGRRGLRREQACGDGASGRPARTHPRYKCRCAGPGRDRPAGRGGAEGCRRQARILASGLPVDFFDHDGQILRTVRTLALSAGPRPGEMLWDLGAGSGSVGIEWLLAHRHRCIAVERDTARATLCASERYSTWRGRWTCARGRR